MVAVVGHVKLSSAHGGAPGTGQHPLGAGVHPPVPPAREAGSFQPGNRIYSLLAPWDTERPGQASVHSVTRSF